MPKRIVLAGAGLIGQRHIGFLEASKDADLVAVVEPSPDANMGGAPRFETLEECLADIACDGLIIATPNHLHVSQGLTAVSHGLPMLIEKPIASISTEAETLVAAAEDATVPLLVGHHRRHNPRVEAAKTFLDEHGAGQLVAVDGKFWLYKPDDYFEQAWRRAPGAGPVFINLLHDIDLLRYLCGEIVAVQAVMSSAVRGFAVEDTAAVILEFASGALGTFLASDTAVSPWSWEFTAEENPAYPHTPGAAYRISGTEAALTVPDLTVWRHPEEKSWWGPIEQHQLEASKVDTFDAQLAHFLDVIDGDSPLVSGAEALQSLRVVEAIMEAARTQQRCQVHKPTQKAKTST